MSATQPNDESDERVGLTVSEACEAILTTSRRDLLYIIDEAGEDGVDINEASRRIAARQHNIDPSEVSDEQRKTEFINLTHKHIPKLERYRIITDLGKIRPAENFKDALNAAKGVRLSLGIEVGDDE